MSYSEFVKVMMIMMMIMIMMMMKMMMMIMFFQVAPGEKLWQDLDSCIDNLKSVFLHQLSVRSATSIGI